MNRLRIIAILVITLWASAMVNGQCATDSVCIPQSTLDRANAAVSELIEARKVISAFQAERAAFTVEREAANRVIERLNAVISTQDRLRLEYDAVIKLYKETVEMQAALIEKLTARLAAPQSAWSKFLSALKTVATLAAGILLGRSL